AAGQKRLVAGLEKGAVSLTVVDAGAVGGLAGRVDRAGGTGPLPAKRLSRAPSHAGHHAGGSPTLPRRGTVRSLLAAVAAGDVSGRSQNHPAVGNAAQSLARNGAKGSLRATHRTQSGALDDGASGPPARRGVGTNQLQRHAGCAAAVQPRHEPNALLKETAGFVGGTAAFAGGRFGAGTSGTARAASRQAQEKQIPTAQLAAPPLPGSPQTRWAPHPSPLAQAGPYVSAIPPSGLNQMCWRFTQGVALGHFLPALQAFNSCKFVYKILCLFAAGLNPCSPVIC